MFSHLQESRHCCLCNSDTINTTAVETNYRVLKYSNTGSLLWAKTIDAGFNKNDTAKAVFVKNDAIYITGNAFNGSKG